MILQGLTFFGDETTDKANIDQCWLLFVDIPQALRQFYHPSYWQQSSYTLENPKQPKEAQLFAEYTHPFIYFAYLAYLIINYFLYTRTCMICIYYRVMCANMSCLNGVAIWHLAIILWQTPRVRKRPSMVSQSSSVSQQGAHRTGTSWIMLDQGAAAKFFRYLGSGQNFIQLSVVCIYSSVNHASFRFLRGFPMVFERFFARKSWQVRMIGKWMHWLGEDPAWGQWRYNSMNMIVSIIE